MSVWGFEGKGRREKNNGKYVEREETDERWVYLFVDETGKAFVEDVSRLRSALPRIVKFTE